MSAEKAVIIATGEGPFLGLHAGASGETRPLGLEGKGPVRAVIHDHKEQGRLYAATLARASGAATTAVALGARSMTVFCTGTGSALFSIR